MVPHLLWDLGVERAADNIFQVTVTKLNSFAMKSRRRTCVRLERISTAFFIQSEPDNSELNSVEVAKRVIELKPHISFGEARVAVSEVAGLRDKLSKAGVLQ